MLPYYSVSSEGCQAGKNAVTEIGLITLSRRSGGGVQWGGDACVALHAGHVPGCALASTVQWGGDACVALHGAFNPMSAFPH